MTTISITEAREHFADLANKVAFGGERVYVARNGKPSFALVPIADINALEALEDSIDIHEAEKAVRRGTFTDWKEAKKKLGL
jgi:prevent-host-death family protein